MYRDESISGLSSVESGGIIATTTFYYVPNLR